jgi:coenzyme F420-reducing hydrogenase gamma subunit
MNYRTMYLSDADVQNVVDILLQNNIRESVDNTEHVRNIYASRAQVDYKIASGICPKCGGSLVKRTGRYGSFYGCSNYPKCRFTAK